MADDFAASTGTTGTLGVNSPTTARIDADTMGDQDWFAVTLTAGTRYRIDVMGRDSDPALNAHDPHLGGLHDAAGTLISATTNYNGGVGSDARTWYVAPTTGTYYVSAGIAPGRTVSYDESYTVLVQDDWDDIGPGLAEAPVLVPGAPALPAEIDERDDTDLFALSLDAGQQVRITATGGTSTYSRGFLTDVRIVGISDAGGAPIAGTGASAIGQTSAEVFFTAPAAGTYHVEVAGEGTAREGLYSVAVETDELTDGIDTPGIVTGAEEADRSRSSTLFAGDEDWIVVPLQEGGTYEFLVTGTDGTPRVALHDAAGAPIAGAEGDSGLVFTASAGGSHFAAITGDSAATQGDYTLRVLRDTATADSATGAVAPTDGSPVVARIHSGDADWLAVTLTGGQSHDFEIAGEAGFTAAITGLHDSAGSLVAAPSGGAPWRYTPAEDGTYFVALAAADGTSAGNATLRVVVDDYASDTTTTGRVPPDGCVTGRLERAGDRDWFAADLLSSHVYVIDLEGSTVGAGSLRDPYFDGVFDAAGNRLPGTSNDDSGGALNSRISFAPAEDGTYYLAARAYADSGTGSYTLSLTGYLDDYAGDVSTTGTIAVGGRALGSILPGSSETDWFAATLEGGESYRITLGGTGTGSDPLFHERVAVHDASGVLISGPQYGSYGGTAELVVPIAEGGTYYIEAASRQVGSGTSYWGDYGLDLVQLVTVGGTDGNDWLTLPATGGQGLAAIRGGTGVDMMSFSGLDGGVTLDLHRDLVLGGGTDPFRIAMDSIENVTGTSFDDVFSGSDRSELTRGLGGRDLFHGSDGERDTIDGGASVDTLSYAGSFEGVEVSLLRGRGNGGDADGDRIRGIENVIGSQHDDFIWGDHGNNRLEGGRGDDTLVGNGGDDYILAGFGIDVVVYSGTRAEYEVVQDGIRTEVTHLGGGGDGADVIGHAEVLRFADGDLIL